MVSNAKRRANDKWDSLHSFRFSVKMGRGEADALKAACAADGLTPHAFFLRAAREMIAAHAASDADAGSGGEAKTLTREASGDSLTGKGGGAEEDADSDSG